MKKLKPIFPYCISYLCAGALGYLFHYLFKFFSSSPFVAPFFPINESVFEHLKLLLYPFMLVSLFEILIRKKKFQSTLPYRIFGITFSIIFLPIVYYILKRLFGNVHIGNIILYFVFLFLSYFITYWFEKKETTPSKSIAILAYCTLFLLVFLFTLLTYLPPEAELFKDPTLQTYGYLF